MDKVTQAIQEEMIAFETYFKHAVKSRVSLLDRIMRYIVNRKGKQLRPRFVLLSAKLGGPVNESTLRAASLVELLHTATLVHDDVVDEADKRRGFFSINALWKNKVAVLVGDYLLSKGMLLSLENEDYKILKILSGAIKMMIEGELLQLEKSRNLNLDESVYYDIIKGKTASLLSSACASGACTTFTDDTQIEKMRLFGEKAGMAFQIKDDLFDYGNTEIGKPTGNDIKEQKLTLPLIHTLNNCSSDLKKQIIYIVKNQNTNKAKIRFVTDAVKDCGGIEYATKKMTGFRDEALDILYSFQDNHIRQALEQLVRYTTDRNF